MGKTGPVSPGAKHTKGLTATLSDAYFPPEPDMGEEAVEIWRRIVLSMPEGYFTDSDRPQLRGFCEASVTQAKAAQEINSKGFKEVYKDKKGVMRKNPWLDIRKEALAILNSTATKLRISKSTQVTPEQAGRATLDAQKAKNLAEKEDSIANLMQ